jgi:hypothetical protein
MSDTDARITAKRVGHQASECIKGTLNRATAAPEAPLGQFEAHFHRPGTRQQDQRFAPERGGRCQRLYTAARETFRAVYSHPPRIPAHFHLGVNDFRDFFRLARQLPLRGRTLPLGKV